MTNKVIKHISIHVEAEDPPTTVRTWQIVKENPGIEVKVVTYPSERGGLHLPERP